MACEDYNDCSVNDTCIIEYELGFRFLRCQGEASGLPCDDNNECTANDACVEIPTPDYYATDVTCLGELIDDKPCDDNNSCTYDDMCGYYVSRPIFSICSGTRVPGPCDYD
jgi:hypothetical protein